ncbi:hypothetical protein ABK040_016776 [Willaertia magna]
MIKSLITIPKQYHEFIYTIGTNFKYLLLVLINVLFSYVLLNFIIGSSFINPLWPKNYKPLNFISGYSNKEALELFQALGAILSYLPLTYFFIRFIENILQIGGILNYHIEFGDFVLFKKYFDLGGKINLLKYKIHLAIWLFILGFGFICFSCNHIYSYCSEEEEEEIIMDQYTKRKDIKYSI